MELNESPYNDSSFTLTVIVDRQFFMTKADWINQAMELALSFSVRPFLRIQLRNKGRYSNDELIEANHALPLGNRIIFNCDAGLARRFSDRNVHLPQSQILDLGENRINGASIHCLNSLKKARETRNCNGQ